MIDELFFNIRRFKDKINFSYGDLGVGGGHFHPFGGFDGFILQFYKIPSPENVNIKISND